jgi:hypothetical protein
MKYVSIDIETTGLNPNEDQVLEIGAIIEDTENKLSFEDAPKFSIILEHPKYIGSATAISMNARIFDILGKIPSRADDASKYRYENYIVKAEDAAQHFAKWLSENGIKYPVNAAGKNFGTFDLRFLKNLPGWEKRIIISQRIIDPATLFADFKNDSTLPNLSECKRRVGIEEKVTHVAIEDAWDVIQLLRTKY